MRERLGRGLDVFHRRVLPWLRARRVGLVTLFIFVALPLWLFGALAEEVIEGEGFAFDEPVLHLFDSLAGPGLDRVMVTISLIGYRYGVVPLDLFVAVSLLVLRRWGDLRFWAVAVGGAALLNVAAKLSFSRARPDLWESIAPEHTYSFPSGHAMGSMALVAALYVLLRPTPFRMPVVVLGATFVILVACSRVYLGVHYPSDILAGWAASLAWVVGVSELLYDRWGKAAVESEPVDESGIGVKKTRPS